MKKNKICFKCGNNPIEESEHFPTMKFCVDINEENNKYKYVEILTKLTDNNNTSYNAICKPCMRDILNHAATIIRLQL